MAQVANEIQQRLKSLEDIRHLLRSVRAMSAIRWRRARARLRSAEQYASAVEQQLALATAFPTPLTRGAHHRMNASSPWEGEGRGEGGTGLIALTSDRGLCGMFNVGLVAHALDFIERKREKGGEIKVIALGGYGERFFRSADCELLYTQHFPLTHAVSFVEARDIVAQVKRLYETRAFDTLYLIYNQFVSFGRYQRIELRLLPPDLNAIWRRGRASAVADGVHPDDRMAGTGPGSAIPTTATNVIPSEARNLTVVPEDLILGTPPQNLQDFLLWEHLAVQVYLALIESMVSEHGARLQTMDAAITNLDERMEQLRLQYHAIRQENITREVLEVQSNTRGKHRHRAPRTRLGRALTLLGEA